MKRRAAGAVLVLFVVPLLATACSSKSTASTPSGFPSFSLPTALPSFSLPSGFPTALPSNLFPVPSGPASAFCATLNTVQTDLSTAVSKADLTAIKDAARAGAAKLQPETASLSGSQKTDADRVVQDLNSLAGSASLPEAAARFATVSTEMVLLRTTVCV